MKWFGHVFLGLEHLHVQLEMLHLDIKPDNIVFDTEGNAKLTDFGFAHQGKLSNGDFMFGVPPGSPEYVAPEVLLKKQFGYSADLYSLGVMLWVMLTGGVSNSWRPCNPPCAEWRPPNFEPLLNNWQKLQEAMTNPQAYSVPAVFDPRVEDLILRLTQRGENWKDLSHTAVRQHPLVESLCLPGIRASHTSE